LQLNVAKPIDSPNWTYEDRFRLEETKYDIGVREIQRFLKQKLGYILRQSDVFVNEKGEICLDTPIQSNEPFDMPPTKWFGISVIFSDVDMPTVNDFLGFLKTRSSRASKAFLAASDVPTSLAPQSDYITVGQTIRIDSASESDGSAWGLSSLFVNGARSIEVAPTFAIVPRHLIGNREEAEVYAVSERETKERTELLLGKADFSSYDEALFRELQRDEYTILSDVKLVRIDDSLLVKNEINGKPVVGTKSSFYHLMKGDKLAYIDGTEIGKLSTVFNHRQFDYNGFGSLRTEVFSVQCYDHVDVGKILSGATVHTGRYRALGFVIGRNVSDNQIFCVEFEKLFGKLGLELS